VKKEGHGAMKREPVGQGQESVWDFPRPAIWQDCSKSVRVEFAGQIIAQTTRSRRVLETSHPPTYYIPPDDIHVEYCVLNAKQSYCEWKGQASYFDITVAQEVDGKKIERLAKNAAWFYSNPTRSFQGIKSYVAFYAHLMDSCFVDDEKVDAQAGSFYGGWVTKDIVGPIKGGPGTFGW